MMVASSSELKVGLVLQCFADALHCFLMMLESVVEVGLCLVLLQESSLPPLCY